MSYLHGIDDAIKGMLFVVIKLTPPYAPQHNGVFERWNRTLLDIVRSMINLTTLSLSFWDYALETATRILNMILTKKFDKTPYELWYGQVPNLSYLKVRGCEALVKRDTPDKLQQRYVKCIFIGYPKETMGYYFYFPLENKIVVARYVEFLKKNLLSQEVSGRAEELKEIQDKDTSPSEINSEIPMEVKGFKPPQEEVILVRRLDLNKTQGASTPEEVKCMQNVPYASPENHTGTAMKTNLKYLRNIKDMILVYGGNSEAELRGDCYCNARFQTNRDDIKSQKGHVSALNRGAVDWKSSKQSTAAMSAT
ncbi:retrotransposon protein, putative, ty1-copia subclass [Tanacetum coccineum]